MTYTETDDDIISDLIVLAVMPQNGLPSERFEYGPSPSGVVQFQFSIPYVTDEGGITLSVPYVGQDGMDAGVKEAAKILARIAEALARKARSLAK